MACCSQHSEYNALDEARDQLPAEAFDEVALLRLARRDLEAGDRQHQLGPGTSQRGAKPWSLGVPNLLVAATCVSGR